LRGAVGCALPVVELGRAPRRTTSANAPTFREGAMILVRDVFQIQPEQMRAAREAVRNLRAVAAGLGYPLARMLTDLTGEYYTLVLESEFLSLGDFEKALQATIADKNWQAGYARVRPMILSGRREVFQIIE
jgi:hypothetical protein